MEKSCNSRICAIHQPNFMPWLGYFYKMQHVDSFVFLDTVDIEIATSHAITNRVKIKTDKGPSWISIPIRKSNDKQIQHILIDHSQQWQNKILKTIYLQYKKTAHFDEFYHFLETILAYKTDYLADYNIRGTLLMAKYLGINTQFKRSSEMGIATNERNMRLIEICQHTNANKYLSGNGGKNYHDENLFKEKGIQIIYTQFEHPFYKQQHGVFEPGMSIIDYCFNVGKELWK